jgi:hypothetical protein
MERSSFQEVAMVANGKPSKGEMWRARLWPFEVLGWVTGVGAILFGAVSWHLEADDRAKERHYRAWELINSARGSTGDGGRRDALQDLNEDDVDLTAAPLAEANLKAVQLPKARLLMANFARANLIDANFAEAKLGGANFAGARLWAANLTNANLSRANLAEASLYLANFAGADLNKANLTEAKFCRTIIPDGTLNNRDCPPESILPNPSETPSPPD